MKHFAEARRAASIASSGVAGCTGLCLLWDLRGQLRVLARLEQGADPVAIALAISDTMKEAAGAFWSGTTWIWAPDKKLQEAEKVVYAAAWSEARPVSAGPPEVRELDRHLSKETWFGAPLTPPWPLVPQTPPILSFYSFKGGVGRTTALAAFAVQLARQGKRVCVVDLDLEAPGIGTILTSAVGQAEFGVLDYLLEAALGELPQLDDYVQLCDDPQIVGSGPPITVVPAGRLDDDYLEKLARIDFRGVLTTSNPAAENALATLLTSLKRDRKAEYILIDSRSGLHDIGGLALNGLAHLDVLFGIASEQSWQGLRLIVSHLGARRIQRGLPHQQFALVHAMAPSVSSADRQLAVDAFRDRAHQVLSEVFYSEEPEGGWPPALPEEAWPVPAIEDETEPHYAIPIAFNPDIQRFQSLGAIATTLTEGDYAAFNTALLDRLGRTTP